MKKKSFKKFIPFIVLIICFVVLPITFARYEQIINKKVTINVRKPNYIVYFNSNRDDGNPDDTTSQSFVYGTAQNLYANTFTNGSETFHGWNTERDGSGTAYTDQQEVSNLTTVDGDEIVLYAQWGDAEIWITYNFGNESFGGQKCINTGIGLFSSTNVNRDFEISMDVSNFTYIGGQDTNRNVFLCNQNETGTPYPGFAFHYRDSAIRTQINCTSVPNVNRQWGKTSGNIKFNRTENKFYQDGVLLYDFANQITPFAAPLSIGANLDVNGNPRRFSKVDLSNITIKLKYTYAEYSALYQNLPVPHSTSAVFDGWYTAPDGGTKITSQALLESAGGVIYPHWNASATYTVTFDSNSSSNLTSTQSVPYNTPTVLNTNTFTNTGYRFLGWNRVRNGTGTAYADGATITIMEDTTLYAQWLSNPVNSYTASTLVFDANDMGIVDTGVYLFSSANIHRNFEISFDVTAIGSNSNQATLINGKDESGAPYPGFVFRIDKGKLMLKGDSTAQDTYSDNRETNTVQNLRLVRISDVLYYSINNEPFAVLMDYSNIVRTFDAPIALGGLIRPNASRERAFRGTLSNVVIQFISDNATLADYQNSSPSPSPSPAPAPSNPDGNNSVGGNEGVQSNNNIIVDNTNLNSDLQSSGNEETNNIEETNASQDTNVVNNNDSNNINSDSTNAPNETDDNSELNG